MSFRSSVVLWLMMAIPLIAVSMVLSEQRRRRRGRRFVSERLRGIANTARTIRPLLLTLALAAALIALAGPRAGFITVPIVAQESSRIIVLDVSHSMGADDAGVSRLAAAKGIAKRITAAHPGRIALIAFESAPEIVAPLTTDSEAVIALIDSLHIGELGQPGSDIGRAIDAASRLARADSGQKADVVLISDGEDQGSRLREAIRAARDHGVTIASICIGNTDGSTIPTDDGPMRDSSGEGVITYARPDTLRSVAQGTGGLSFHNPFGERSLDPLLTEIAEGTAKQKDVRVPVDRYQWPLACAFILLLAGSVTNRGAE